MSWRGWQVGLVVAALCAVAPRAESQSKAPDRARSVGTASPSGGRARVGELLRAGAEAAAAKKWDACVSSLSEAAAVEGTAKTWGDLGLCEEQAGRFVAAFGHLSRAMEGAPTQPTKEPWTRYKAALARVMERVAVLTVSASPPNAQILLDGRPLGVADGRVFAVEPGTHTVGARLEGYEDVVEPPREMRAGEAPASHPVLVPKAKVLAPFPAPGPSVKPVTKLPPPVELPPWYRPGWSPRGALVGLAWVGAATVLVSGQVTLGLELDRQSLERGAPSQGCLSSSSAPCMALHERAMQRNVAGDVFIGASIATFALGGATVIANILDRGAVRPSVGLQAGPSGGGIVVGGVW